MTETNVFKIQAAKGYSIEEPTTVATVHGEQTAEPGEWVIEAEDGGLHVVPGEVVDAWFVSKEQWVGERIY